MRDLVLSSVARMAMLQRYDSMLPDLDTIDDPRRFENADEEADEHSNVEKADQN